MYTENKFYLKNWQPPDRHTNVLIEKVQELLHECQLKLTDIHYFILDIGPGSFTGIRVGVNFFKTVAFCSNKNIYTINSLDILNLKHTQRASFSAISSITNEFFVQNNQTKDLTTMTLDELKLTSQSASILTNSQNLLDNNPLKLKLIASELCSKQMIQSFLKTPKQFTEVNYKKLLPLYAKKSAPEALMEKQKQTK